MPPKYSHVKRRPPSKKSSPNSHGSARPYHPNDHRNPTPHVDRSISQAASAMSKLEHTIARIILLRFEQDIVRLFSTHLSYVALLHLPTFVLRCVTVGGPSWVAANADGDEIKDFFRGAIAMDLRQAGERVATKSVLWTYTALRHFAKSNGVPICQKSGLHSVRLLPHYDALRAHLDSLESQHPPPFTKPPHLGPMTDGIRELMDACKTNYRKGDDWRTRVREGYDRACQTLWAVASEFDVRGYGLVLREKLSSKWCDCGCSTDHLSEVCEKTVRMEEEEGGGSRALSGKGKGKEREWDGRGSGVCGWGTEEEEDVWGVELDFVRANPEGKADCSIESDMTVGELMEWRYLRAEREKEQGNKMFKKGDYEKAVERYKSAYCIEPEVPHYQLNLAAAYLKMNKYIEAERACDIALGQHDSVKGRWRRAQARKAQNRIEDALRDLRAVLYLQPSNAEALAAITALCPPAPPATHGPDASCSSSSSSSSMHQSPPASASVLAHSNWVPTRKEPTPLPFPRSATDDRKLGISSIPITVEIPDDMPFFTMVDGAASESTGTSSSSNNGSKAAYAGSGSGGTVKHTFWYPCWERYMVEKMSG